jgi:hypothetical protein
MPNEARTMVLLTVFSLLAACGSSPGLTPATSTPQVIGALPDEPPSRSESKSPDARGGGGPDRTRTPVRGREVDRALLVGRVRSVDRNQRTAIVDLQGEAPPAALVDGAELLARDFNTLAQTGLLKTSRNIRGVPLAVHIVSGQPSPGDEVVWLAP